MPQMSPIADVPAIGGEHGRQQALPVTVPSTILYV